MVRHLSIFCAVIMLCAAPAKAQDVAAQPGDAQTPAVQAPASPDDHGDAASATKDSAVISARVSSADDRARLIVDLSAATAFAIAFIEDEGPVIAVDVRAKSAAEIADKAPPTPGIVDKFSVQMAGEDRARTWLRLAKPAKVQQAYVLEAFEDQPARLIVDLVPTSIEEFRARAVIDRTASIGRNPELSDRSVTPEVVTERNPARPLIVLDPGHGGVDSGAAAPNGMTEKEIVLSFAKVLQKMLVDTGKFDVALTRDGDEFLKLEERVALARQNKADLFISIHADSFQDEAVRGASIYTRDEDATDVLDKVLADRENRVDLIAGFALPRMQDPVVDILVDLMRREMRRQAYGAARAIVAQMQPSVRLRRFPVRKADFFVLQAPDVPSLLLELGFLSNATDIANLTTDAWKDRVAQALARGIASYFDDLARR